MCVRAWRGLRFNEQYAVKLEKKLAKRKAQEKAKADAVAKAKAQTTSASNPFSMQNSATPNPFGLGAQIFGETPRPDSPPPENEDVDDADETGSVASDASEESLIIALASTSLEASPWASSPAYPALYLSTVAEYVPPPPKSKIPPGAKIIDPLDEIDEDGKKANWVLEAYENSLEIDHIFERFTKRVGYEAEQCVRYDLNGMPLPFASDEVLDMLFPLPPAEPLPVTKAAFKVVPVQKRSYNPTLTPCPFCKSKRVFECQLMPNIINVLRKGDAAKKLTDEERRKEVERALKSGEASGARGMEWGTCMIFSCAKDCCTDDAGEFEARDAWREELVLVQWDK
ncbi:hypothetical protein HWV62_21518 [Athelia sp. TMB]|nr:hypothetical protein HWV62_21518 [Athelia sp. TMB]